MLDINKKYSAISVEEIKEDNKGNELEIKTVTKTISELLKTNESPLPLELIPNNMGINLSAVESITWTKKGDGQLVNLTINFAPNDKLNVPTPSVEELAAKWNVEISVVTEQLNKGIEVEKEHTTDLNVASEIARDHLNEDLYYYEKLAKVEGEDNA